MALPGKTEFPEDRLDLARAIELLLEAHKSLKKYSKSKSVCSDPALTEAVRIAKRKTKKALEYGKTLLNKEVSENA